MYSIPREIPQTFAIKNRRLQNKSRSKPSSAFVNCRTHTCHLQRTLWQRTRLQSAWSVLVTKSGDLKVLAIRVWRHLNDFWQTWLDKMIFKFAKVFWPKPDIESEVCKDRERWQLHNCLGILIWDNPSFAKQNKDETCAKKAIKASHSFMSHAFASCIITPQLVNNLFKVFSDCFCRKLYSIPQGCCPIL